MDFGESLQIQEILAFLGTIKRTSTARLYYF
ncbi:hypothetical protein GKR41_00250 [Candidatus Vallotia lariciata]|nr:hypothetical protein GKR41_00250 [Candidatus Vallotia lariciata]